jgi:hypothetical protein
MFDVTGRTALTAGATHGIAAPVPSCLARGPLARQTLHGNGGMPLV